MAPMPDPVPELPPAATNLDDLEPQGPVRKDGRVFFPETGWVDEAEFWAIYETDPGQLPPTLDLHAVHQLRADYFRERGDADPHTQ